MIAYKAFEPGLVCREYQFQMGVNATEQANCRENGFHCAHNPLDCLSYYSDINNSEFYLVKAEGDIDEDEKDTKIACTNLTIVKRLASEEFILHGLSFMLDHPKREWSPLVKKDHTQAHNGYAIVRGLDPSTKGDLGDILALVKEDLTGKIIQLAISRVDGEAIMPGLWYDVDFLERQAPWFE